MEGWTADEANKLRELLGCTPEMFARRLKIHKRTALRWRDEETHPAPALWEDLDNLLLEAAHKLAPWLSLDQLTKMQRRDLLKLLAASASIPLAGLDLLWSGAFAQVSNASLRSLEEISTVLAGQYNSSPPDTLLGSVMGHLEKSSGFLRSGTMYPSQRQRLESIVADGAIFVGVLSMQAGKLAQADVHFGLAEKMARQADNMVLLTQVFAEKALLHYYDQAPSQVRSDPRPRVELLEQAQVLASRHASSIVKVAVNGWLAEERAAGQDDYGADQACEASYLALGKAHEEGLAGTGFCSSTGSYSGWGEGKIQHFKGAVELALQRPSAVSTIETSLQLTINPRGRGARLADLAMALIAGNQPEEACASLIEAHAIGIRERAVVILHEVFRARALMPPTWNSLRCVRELDERLRFSS